MGLKKLVKHISAPVRNLIGSTATGILFPAVPLTNLAAGLADRVVAQTMTPRPMPRQLPGPYQVTGGPQPSYNVTYGPPNYGAPSYGGGYGGGGYFPSYQPTEQFYGGSPWGYSTGLETYSIPQYQGYSAEPQQRTWEDLILTALPLFL